VDFGGPLLASRAVSADGIADHRASRIGGISTVSADIIEEASELAAGCPVIEAGGAVEVYEAIEMTK
jgi:hypothetical protein